jgi:S-layer homology domain
VILGAALVSTGLTGCDRKLQQAFSADPKATSPTPVASPSISESLTPTSLTPSPSGTPVPVQTALQPYVEDVVRLGTSADPALFGKGFSPNEPAQRGTFARWLVAMNNRMYRDRPSRQIRIAEVSTPTFQDVPSSNPDFAYIQGLAEAGYVSSPLSGDRTQTRFRPNELLTRETLLLWKVPVDRQQILPTVSAERVKQLWGFKDANRIAVAAVSAVAADHQNGDLSNIRRLLGSTLLFQPQKPVTQAEAVAALWFIGAEGEGLSAQNLLRSEQQTRSQLPKQLSSPTPTPEAVPSTSVSPGPQQTETK